MSWLIRSDVHSSVFLISMSLRRYTRTRQLTAHLVLARDFVCHPRTGPLTRVPPLRFWLSRPQRAAVPRRAPHRVGGGKTGHAPRAAPHPHWRPLARFCALFFADLNSSGGEKGWTPAAHLASVGYAYAHRVRRDTREASHSARALSPAQAAAS